MAYAKNANNVLFQIIFATLFISSISLIGGVVLYKKNFLSHTVTPYLVSFAAGVILTVAFFDLLPEAQELAQKSTKEINIFIPAFLGVVTFFFIERFLLWFHHHDNGHGYKPASMLVLIGDGFHNFVDGIIIAAAFLANPALGILSTLAIAAHEIPQEIADFSILVHGGMKRSQALFFNFLSSLTALAGAIGGYYFLTKIQTGLPYLLALSAGMFIYIACADLIPDLHTDFKKQRKLHQAVPFILGIIVIYLSISFLN